MSEIKQLKMKRMLDTKHLLETGHSTKSIALILKLSVSTIQRYKREIENQVDYPTLRELLSVANYTKRIDLRKTVENLSYSQICCVCRNERIQGKNKQDKIEGIIGLFRWINYMASIIPSEV